MKAVELYNKMFFINIYLRACIYFNGLEGEVIKKAFEKHITNIYNEYIDINFEDILVTYNCNHKKLCDVVEIYDKRGAFLEFFKVSDYLKVEVD